jgi:hypothetical protein
MIPSTSPSDRTAGPNFVASGPTKPSFVPSSEENDSLSTDKAEHLRAALANQPEARPEVVARGLALAADPAYPSDSVIRSVASQILASPDLSEDES